MSRKLTLGFSPCPNDTFIFDAIVNGQIDCEGLEFEIIIADVEELNRAALNRELDITKLSYGVYPKVSDSYLILDSGSALGRGNGPLLVSKYRAYPDEVSDMSIAIPGENTTANMLLKRAYPNLKEVKSYLFSDIEEVVLSGECDAGVLIHEGRFTYKDVGLHKIVDLGELYEENTGLPIPLGGIVIKASFESELIAKFNRILKRSIEFAFKNPDASIPYIEQHAQELSPEVIKSHIELYVNSFSLSLGEEGRNAVTELLGEEVVEGKFVTL